ncbi:hypothetical protein [Leucobacter aridicollis]|uniref:hypothetical protein n=1 Tax=Leucobacter aridicollis TaxID=283878 RepID=UPI00216960B0|nr:hypothetical protein [Leucobacter aridicollis]MCS3426752.1 hypothetical protein [Leucobacter aridicollis]
MADNEEQNTEAEETEEAETEEVEADEEEAEEVEEDGFAEERTKLKGALAKERTAKRDLARENRELKAKLAAKDKPADANAIDEAKREAAAEATTRANERIAKAEVKAAAKGRFADPSDVGLYLDLSEFVDEDGEVDADAIDDALTDLLEKKPHLAAEKKRFQGGGHQGAKAPAKPAQLTAEQYNAMSREEKRKARNEGRVNKILGAN